MMMDITSYRLLKVKKVQHDAEDRGYWGIEIDARISQRKHKRYKAIGAN